MKVNDKSRPLSFQPPYPYTTSSDYLRMAGEIVTLASGIFFFLTNVSQYADASLVAHRCLPVSCIKGKPVICNVAVIMEMLLLLFAD